MRSYAQKYNENALVFIISCPSFSQLWSVFCSVPLWKQPKQSLQTPLGCSSRGEHDILVVCRQFHPPFSPLRTSPAHSFCVQTARSWKLNEAVIVVKNRTDWQPFTSPLMSPEWSSFTESCTAFLSTSDSTSQGRKSLLPCFQHAFWLFSGAVCFYCRLLDA